MVKRLAMQICGGRGFQTEGTANAKMLSKNPLWWVRETERRPEWRRVIGDDVRVNGGLGYVMWRTSRLLVWLSTRCKVESSGLWYHEEWSWREWGTMLSLGYSCNCWGVVIGGFKTVELQDSYFGWTVLVAERRMEGVGGGRHWTLAKRTVGGCYHHQDLSLGRSKSNGGWVGNVQEMMWEIFEK